VIFPPENFEQLRQLVIQLKHGDIEFSIGKKSLLALDNMIQEPSLVATTNIVELAKVIKLSPASLTRLAKLLGFHGFNQFQNLFKQKNKILKFFYWENKQFSFDESILNSESSYFFGYWQTFKYFKDIRHLLLKELELKENLNLENSEMLKNIKKTNSISLHIRRGDYLKIKHQNVCDLSYYERAVNKMIKEIENPSFFIFSAISRSLIIVFYFHGCGAKIDYCFVNVPS